MKKRKLKKFMLLFGVPFVGLTFLLLVVLHCSHIWRVLPRDSELFFILLGIIVISITAHPLYYLEIVEVGIEEGIENAFKKLNQQSLKEKKKKEPRISQNHLL